MDTATSIRTALLVVVAIGFGVARAGSVHAPTRDSTAMLQIDPRDVPFDRYLDLGRSWTSADSDDYQTARSAWQCEHYDLPEVLEESRYVDLGALQFVRDARSTATKNF